MKNFKKCFEALALALMFISATAFAQTSNASSSKQEKGTTSSMTLKCTKGGCCGGKMLCCGDKASTFKKSLEGVKGVSNVKVNEETAEATIEYKGEVKESDLNTAAKKAGFEVKDISSKK